MMLQPQPLAIQSGETAGHLIPIFRAGGLFQGPHRRLQITGAEVGAGDLQAAARTVEEAARAKNWDRVPDTLATLDREWLRLRHQLENFPPESNA